MNKFWALGAVTLLIGTTLCGCASHRQLKVGLVNTNRIVTENPKYMDLNVALQQERQEFYSSLPRDISNLSEAQKKALQEKVNKDANERSDKFDKLYRNFMKQVQTDIEEYSGQIAKSKDIDIVIIDTPNMPTVLYTSGENITTDIMLRMQSGTSNVKND